LNTGCVPSKALLAVAHRAASARDAGRFGIDLPAPKVDFPRVQDYVAAIIAGIAPNDSVERFESLGVRVIQATARFSGRDTVEAGGVVVCARRFVIATGSSPFVPPVPGIEDVPYLTNENIFERRQGSEHLIILGGGPIGIEMAQAHCRLGASLGARVSVIEMATILPKDDPELVCVIRDHLKREGVDIYEGARAIRVEGKAGQISVTIEKAGTKETITGSDLLVAAGRHPVVEGLGLETAGVEYTPAGIAIDKRLRTSNKKIYAIGDVTGGYQFTHVAGYHAGIVIRNALLRLPSKADMSAVPWVTYSDPELAHVGLTEAEALEKGGDIRLLRRGFDENDRARTEGECEGLIKVVTDKKGRILGASIVGAAAGELIAPWVLAMSQGLKIGAMAGAIAPYPTRSEISKHVAGSFYTEKLFGKGMQRLVRFLSIFG
ncbi:MAG: FAD-dependent oxidoreductase, partial [Rhodospirillaceae bacterium]|nr:FAD-dependent oxidoreductase [Rhodospirillaceae bacterium]